MVGYESYQCPKNVNLVRVFIFVCTLIYTGTREYYMDSFVKLSCNSEN